MAQQSVPASKAQQGATMSRSTSRKLLLINAHMLARVTVGCSNMASEPVHAVALCGGDVSAGMAVLSLVSGLSGILQFVLNPTFGTLSDRYGRKPFLLIGPMWNCVGNFLIAMNPTRRYVFALLKVVGKTLQTLSGSTTSSAVLTDLVSGDKLTVWSAYMSTAACTGVILGGWIETAILLLGRGARGSAVVAHTQLLF
jgi:MFS family permease